MGKGSWVGPQAATAMIMRIVWCCKDAFYRRGELGSVFTCGLLRAELPSKKENSDEL